MYCIQIWNSFLIFQTFEIHIYIPCSHHAFLSLASIRTVLLPSKHSTFSVYSPFMPFTVIDPCESPATLWTGMRPLATMTKKMIPIVKSATEAFPAYVAFPLRRVGHDSLRFKGFSQIAEFEMVDSVVFFEIYVLCKPNLLCGAIRNCTFVP
jgi:hypothetical protein